MPVNIYDLEQDRKTLTMEFGSDSLTVTYRPNKLTPARELAILRQARSESLSDENDDDEDIERAEFNINRQLSTFSELVEAWDFLGPLAEKAGERFDLPRDITELSEAQAFCEAHGANLVVKPGETAPIRPDVLKLIGSNFLMLVVTRINEDMRPDPKRRRR